MARLRYDEEQTVRSVVLAAIESPVNFPGTPDLKASIRFTSDGST